MELARAADLVRYHVTGQGALNLCGEDLSVHQAADRAMNAHRAGPLAAILITRQQQYNWQMELHTTDLDTLIGVPLVLSD